MSRLRVEVAWVDAGTGVVRRSLALPEGATIDDALDALDALDEPLAGGLRTRIGADALVVAVYGKPCARTTRLRDGDRVELVGPLVVDPKVARQLRVQQRRADGGDARWKRR